MKRYSLPASLPINLEPYRLLVFFVAVGWVTSLLIDPRVRFRRTPVDGPLVLFAFVALSSDIANRARVNSVQSEVVKKLALLPHLLHRLLPDRQRRTAVFRSRLRHARARRRRRGRRGPGPRRAEHRLRRLQPPPDGLAVPAPRRASDSPPPVAAAGSASTPRRSTRSRSGPRWRCSSRSRIYLTRRSALVVGRSRAAHARVARHGLEDRGRDVRRHRAHLSPSAAGPGPAVLAGAHPGAPRDPSRGAWSARDNQGGLLPEGRAHRPGDTSTPSAAAVSRRSVLLFAASSTPILCSAKASGPGSR